MNDNKRYCTCHMDANDRLCIRLIGMRCMDCRLEMRMCYDDIAEEELATIRRNVWPQ